MNASPSFIDDITLDQLEDDPYPTYARLRREAPVAWIPAADVWFVTRFAECASVGGGVDGFVGASNHPTLQRVFGKPNVLTSGGETHADLRQGIDPSLRPKTVEETIDDIVRPVAKERLAALRGRTSGELMAEYLEPVSVEALRRVMGLDDLVDSATLRRWFHDLNIGVANFGLDPENFAIADRASAEIEDVVRPRLDHLARHPDDTMLSHMLWAGREGGTPRSVELVMPSLKVILLGGMQEPGHAAGSTLLGLFGEPEQWQKVQREPDEYIPLAVHEGLRWIAPIGAVERQASVDATLAGQHIPAGSIVQVVLASANRDETHFDEPDRFDMERSNRSHQAFGNGEHFCAGHFFARQVQRIMFEELVPALPGLRPSPDEDPVVTGWVFRAPKILPVEWDAPARVETIALAPTEAPATGDAHDRGENPTPAKPDTLQLVVTAMRLEAKDVLSLELSDPRGRDLPAWQPGSHIDLWITPDRAGQYSLCGDPADRKHWRIAILREAESRGVSTFVHEQVRPGSVLTIGTPRNTFALAPAARYSFIAGGIGITPMIPMVKAARASGTDATLHYSGRDRGALAFLDDVLALGGVAVHLSAEGGRADLREIVQDAASDGAVVYACGPVRMLEELERLGEELAVEVVLEHFDGVDAHRDGDREFEIRLARSNEVLTVGADDTALEVLNAHGHNVLNSCHEGNCGSCETRVLAGRVDHRDVLLTKKQRAANDRMMVCVSRAEDDSLTLDL